MLVLVEFSLSVSDFRTEKIFDLTKNTYYTVLVFVYAIYMYMCVCVYASVDVFYHVKISSCT